MKKKGNMPIAATVLLVIIIVLYTCYSERIEPRIDSAYTTGPGPNSNITFSWEVNVNVYYLEGDEETTTDHNIIYVPSNLLFGMFQSSRIARGSPHRSTRRRA